MSTIVITPNNPQYSTTGPWSAWAGAWGAGSLTYGVDYTQSITLDNTTFPNGTLFSWSFPLYGGPFGVWSYPCIVYGSTPELINPTVPSTQVANFVNLSTTYSAALTVNSGQLDTIFDIWLTSKPYGDMTTAKYELEIIPQTVLALLAADVHVDRLNSSERQRVRKPELGRQWVDQYRRRAIK